MSEVLRKRVSDVITEDEIKSWTPEVPVIILSGTDTGKSYFVKNNLYNHAQAKGQKILMLIHRINCVDQFRMEINADGKQDVLYVDTYQKIQSSEIYDHPYDIDKYTYIVSDEFHYFLEDASYNNTTDVSFKKIMDAKNSIRIFMSGTGTNIAKYIQLYSDVEPKIYKLNLPKPPIGDLSFYVADSSLNSLASGLIESGEKGIFFLNSAEKAYQLYEDFKDYAVFNCSRSNKLHNKVDETEIAKILRNERFDTPIMITTACMDAGVNLIDPDLKHIITDVSDVGSLIQCIGRKRTQSDDDRVDVYIKSVNNGDLGRRKGRLRQSLIMADYLLTHTTDEFLSKFPRQNDMTGIIYDAKVPGSKDLSSKRVNKLMYLKRMLDIDQIDQMIALGNYGYCKFMAKILGKYDYSTDYYNYTVIKGEGTLEDYLSAHTGEVMLTKNDRRDLIHKMDVRRKRKRKCSREILNAALKEDKLPFMIEEFETSRMIDGKKKKYKHAWRIVSHDWNEEN